MITFKKAKVDQAAVLSSLTIRSKKSWRYDDLFMEKMKEYLEVPESMIERDIVYTMNRGDELIGFFSLTNDGKNDYLEDFFLDPKYIGKGYGRKMWQYMIEIASNNMVMNIIIESEPFAEGFFEKMGAVKIGEKVSQAIDNRKLPIMSYFI